MRILYEYYKKILVSDIEQKIINVNAYKNDYQSKCFVLRKKCLRLDIFSTLIKEPFREDFEIFIIDPSALKFGMLILNKIPQFFCTSYIFFNIGLEKINSKISKTFREIPELQCCKIEELCFLLESA